MKIVSKDIYAHEDMRGINRNTPTFITNEKNRKQTKCHTNFSSSAKNRKSGYPASANNNLFFIVLGSGKKSLSDAVSALMLIATGEKLTAIDP